MYVVTNRVAVAPGWEAEFESRFRQRAGQIDKQPGFVRMEILKPVSDKTPFIVATHWQDESAFRAWVDSEDFRLAHANPMPKEAFLPEGGGLEQFEVVISTDRE